MKDVNTFWMQFDVIYFVSKTKTSASCKHSSIFKSTVRHHHILLDRLGTRYHGEGQPPWKLRRRSIDISWQPNRTWQQLQKSERKNLISALYLEYRILCRTTDTIVPFAHVFSMAHVFELTESEKYENIQLHVEMFSIQNRKYRQTDRQILHELI